VTIDAAGRARAFLEAGQFETALRVLGPSVGSPTASTDEMITAADALNGLHRYQDARDVARRIITSEPTSAAGYIAAANAEIGLRSPANAIDLARQAVRLSSDSWVSHVTLARAGIAAKDLGHETERSAAEAVRLNPDSSVPFIIAADFYRAKGQNVQAVECYRRALAIDPASLAAANNMVLILLRRWRAVAGVRILSALLKSHPLADTARYNTIVAVKVATRTAYFLIVLALVLTGLVASTATVPTDAVAANLAILTVSVLMVLVYGAIFIAAAGRGVRRYLLQLPHTNPILTIFLAFLILVPTAAIFVQLMAPTAFSDFARASSFALLAGMIVVLRSHGIWKDFVRAHRR
jgi:tetratricopeptide (TPR) repeat protein